MCYWNMCLNKDSQTENQTPMAHKKHKLYLDYPVSADSDQKFTPLVEIHRNDLMTYIMYWCQWFLPDNRNQISW